MLSSHPPSQLAVKIDCELDMGDDGGGNWKVTKGGCRAVAKEDSQTRPVVAAVVRAKSAEYWTNIGQKMGPGLKQG